MKTGSKAEFIAQMETSIAEFAYNKLIKTLEAGNLTMAVYHNFLKMIFHQVNSSSSTFALAGANCPDDKGIARSYLFHHAEEEKDHWQWVVEDLESSGYKGTDPREEFPRIACQNYMSLNYYIANKYPIARLGIACVLEGIGATYAKKNATILCKKLNLKPEQAKFIFGHGDTDVGHTRDILEVLDKSNLTPLDWGWLTFCAKTAGKLYYQMYEEVLA